jgi:tRNA-specific 2-thiouridylase
MLGIPFYAVNFQPEFDRIVDYFVAEYAAGRTPNPCIVCNTWLKFGRLLDYADRLGAQYVATGHYARLSRSRLPGGTTGSRVPEGPTRSRPAGGTYDEIALCRGRDPSKDQSYVLFGIQRRLLPQLLFPVGGHRKEEIRRIAQRLGLRVAAKRDSQEICFVPGQDHARFVRQRLGGIDTAGEIVTTDGTVVGRHQGIEQFTVGQRKGLRLAFGQPRYVVRIEPELRRVVIGTHEDLARTELTAAGANWLVQGSDAPTPFRAQVKIRYRSPPADATVEQLPGSRFRVCFDRPCYGVAPGQAAVCYQGDRLLGGGWIEGAVWGRPFPARPL